MSFSVTIPVLETDRLTLRAPRESDLAAMEAFCLSDRSRFVGGPFASRWDAWRVLTAGIGHWALRGFGYWSVDRKADGAFVGRVGVLQSGDEPEPELAWMLFDGFDGKGYAQEAARCVCDYAYSMLKMAPLAIHVDPLNAASIAVAKRLGALFEREHQDEGKLFHIYRHLGSEVAQ